MHRPVRLLTLAALAVTLAAGCSGDDEAGVDSTAAVGGVGTTLALPQATQTPADPLPLPTNDEQLLGRWFLTSTGQPTPTVLDNTHGIVVFESSGGGLVASVRKGECGIYAAFVDVQPGTVSTISQLELTLEACDSSAEVVETDVAIACLEAGCDFEPESDGTIRFTGPDLLLRPIQSSDG